MSTKTRPALTLEAVTPTVFLTGPDHDLRQAVDLTVRNVGEPTGSAVTVRIGGETLELPAVFAPAGESTHRVLVPELPARRKVQFTLAASGASAAVEIDPPRHWTVYLVQFAHFDPGYTDLPSSVMDEYVGFFEDILRYCSETDDWPEDAQFRYQVESAWPLLHAIERMAPEAVHELIGRIHEGRIEVNALYCNMITELCSGEELARLLYPAFRLKREFGIPIRVAEHNDIPGISWGLAAALARAGIRYFIPGLPSYFSWEGPYRTFWDKDTIRPGDIATAFWWETPAGDRVLFFNHDDGAGGCFDYALRPIFPYLARAQAAGYPYSCMRCMTNGAHRDNAPPSLEFALAARDHNARWSWPRLVVSTNTPFCEHLSQELGRGERTFRGELPGTDYPIGATCAALETGLNRRTHDALAAAERYATLASAVMDTPYPGYLLCEAWNNVLRYDEHAFGLAYPLGDGHNACRAEKFTYAHRAASAAEDVLTKMANRLADAVHLPDDGRHLVVFNPLARPRTDVVAAPAFPLKSVSRPIFTRPGTPETGFVPTAPSSSVLGRGTFEIPKPLIDEGFQVIDVQTGEVVPHEIVRLDDPRAPFPHSTERFSHGLARRPTEHVEVHFVARDVPALGYRTYCLQPGAAKTPGNDELHVGRTTLESRFYRIELDPKTGAIAALVDKELKRDLVDGKARFGFNQLLGRSFLDGEIAVAEHSRIRIGRRGPVAASLLLTGDGPGCPQRTQEIVLYRDAKRIDLNTRLLKDPDPRLELYLAFPFAISKPQFRYEGALSVIEPVRDQLPGTNTDAATVQHYAAIFNERLGVTWASREAPIALFSELWPGYVSPAHHNARPPGYVHDFLHDPAQLKHGHLYSMLATNNYQTNFYTTQSGDLLFRYSITSHAGPWDPVAAKNFGWDTANPLDQVCMARNESGTLPPAHSFLRVEPDNVELLALKEAEDTRGVIVRLHETAGRETEATVTLAFGTIQSARSCNLVEEDEGQLTASSNSFRIDLRPWDVATVRVLLDRPPRPWPKRPW